MIFAVHRRRARRADLFQDATARCSPASSRSRSPSARRISCSRGCRQRRIKKFIDVLPTALDIIVRGVRAGLPLGDTLRIIANEAQEPVRSEFRKVVESQALGISVPEACAKLAQRVPATETNFFAIVIEIQSKAGGNLSEAIGNLSQDGSRAQEDEGQDRRDVDGGAGFGRHHRRRAVLRHRRALCDLARIYGPAVHHQSMAATSSCSRSAG